MEKAVIIFNPKAGDGKIAEQLTAIIHELQQGFHKVDVLELNSSVSCKELVSQASANADTIIGAGGDGTIHELANAIACLQEKPSFGILPGGTCNDFSRALHMNQNPILAAKQLAAKKIQPVDIGKYNHHYFLNFWGIGLITMVSENIDSDLKERLGRLSYYLSAAQSLNNWEPFHLQLESNDFSYDGKASMLLIANGPFTGGIRPFFPDANLQDGKFDVLLIQEPSFKMVWEALQSRFSDKTFEGDGFLCFQTKALTIQTNPDQCIDADGEKNHYTPARIECLPGFLNMLKGDTAT